MIRTLVRRPPSTLIGWAASAVAAYLGARHSINPTATGAIWAAGGAADAIAAALLLHRALLQQRRTERTTLVFHWMDGTADAYTLEELTRMDSRWWDAPAAVNVTTEAPTDGR